MTQQGWTRGSELGVGMKWDEPRSAELFSDPGHLTSSANMIAGRFAIESPAGAGGMGTVYRARDGATGQAVAVKLLKPGAAEDLERFAREATVLAGLRHPRIVRYIAHGRLDDGTPYLVMEWVNGESLAARMAGDGLTIAEAMLVVRGVATGLAT